jgi:hypothetical protein
MIQYDRIIIGAGIYGLYAAILMAQKSYSVLVIDAESEPFMRGSLINQARLHNGYHYPRSFSTAKKTIQYFQRFYMDYNDCINNDFIQIYAISRHYSWTNAKQFAKFCTDSEIYHSEIDTKKFFNDKTIEKAFETEEFAFDALMLKKKLWHNAIDQHVDFQLGNQIQNISKYNDKYHIKLANDYEISTNFILNTTYAGTNQIHKFLNFEMLNIKYELCEVILCNVSDNIKNVGLTVMDGPFFSVMPFGKTGLHSITSVSKTPHMTSYDYLPTFNCQKQRNDCTPLFTQNCNSCPVAPQTAFTDMHQTAKKFLNSDIKIDFLNSMFTLKPILKYSEIDDSRPTIIKQYSINPTFYTVFSGKINTMYDIDHII